MIRLVLAFPGWYELEQYWVKSLTFGLHAFWPNNGTEREFALKIPKPLNSESIIKFLYVQLKKIIFFAALNFRRLHFFNINSVTLNN